MVGHDIKFDYYLVKCEFELVFKDYLYFPYIKSNLSDNKSMLSWDNFIENVIKDFKNEGYNFNLIAEINIITKANKMDMSYVLYINHNMHAVDWKLITIINKKKNFDQ